MRLMSKMEYVMCQKGTKFTGLGKLVLKQIIWAIKIKWVTCQSLGKWVSEWASKQLSDGICHVPKRNKIYGVG